MIRRPPRSTLDRSSAASDVYKRQDEIVFMASDAGPQAPMVALPPLGTSNGLGVAIVDPLDLGNTRYIYLFLKAGGSSFNAANGYVTYTRDANADEWIDRY